MENTIPSRRLDLDWLRIGAFGLLIAYHVGMYYVTWRWHIKSPQASAAAEPLMLAVNPWRLSLLFVVSGCATAFLLRKPGAGLWALALSRTGFLLLPLLFGMLVVVPPQSYFEVVRRFGYGGNYLMFWKSYLGGSRDFCDRSGCLILPTWNHLWFVAYLWFYTMIVCAVRGWMPRAAHRAAEAARSFLLRGWRLLILPWLALAASFLVLLPRFGSTHAFVGDYYNHAQYLLVFGLGYLLAFDEAAWTWIGSRRWLTLAIALLCYCAVAVYYIHSGGTPPAALFARIGMGAAYGALQWAALLAALGWARHGLLHVRDSSVCRYLTDAMFCYYVLHQTIIILAAKALQPFGLQPRFEAPVLVGITVVGCAIGYEAARRLSLLRPLLGIRAPARNPERVVTAQSAWS
jgi:hypothetical protein